MTRIALICADSALSIQQSASNWQLAISDQQSVKPKKHFIDVKQISRRKVEFLRVLGVDFQLSD